MVKQPKAVKSSKQVSSKKLSGKSTNGGHKLTMAELLAATGYKIPVIRRGQEVRGQIVSITPSEILIEIGAKSEGIVSGRELSSIADIVSRLALGDTIDAIVLFVENDAGQVVLSLRKLSGEKRWQDLEEKLKSNEAIEVVALEVNRGGIICDWLGLRGFLPASQLSLTAQTSREQTSRNSVHDESLRQTGTQAAGTSKLEQLIGKRLLVVPLEVDRSTNRLIFSQRQQDARDLSEILALFSKIKIGQKFAGVVTAVLPFGVFVEIDVGSSGSQAFGSEVFDREAQTESAQARRVVRSSGKNKPDSPVTRQPDNQGKLEGLVHISELSWEKIDDPAKLFKVGDKIDVMVTAKDEVTGRLNLSIKQLFDDPFTLAASKYSLDQTVTGKVSKVTPYGVFVAFSDPSTDSAHSTGLRPRGSDPMGSGQAGSGQGVVEGLMHISKIPPNVSFKQGEVVECLIESIDSRLRRISLVPVVREKPILYR
ncbi:30S ribosomal protein S1 [Candidatus Curtissbacteria bacterium]|nr:30S ribosomal protein S1 [Candidatus Curtissbacteria bacterium]